MPQKALERYHWGIFSTSFQLLKIAWEKNEREATDKMIFKVKSPELMKCVGWMSQVFLSINMA